MAPEDGEGGTVSYRVKDILGEINGKLDRVMDKLDQKAERSEVHELKNRVAALELRGKLADDRAKQTESTFTKREKIVGVFLAGAAVVLDPLLHSGWFK